MGPIQKPGSGRLFLKLLSAAGFIIIAFSGFSLATSSHSTNPAPQSSSPNYQLPKSVVGAAGGLTLGGTGWTLQGTLGQSTPIGVSSDNSMILAAGFWHGLVQPVSDVPGPLESALLQNYPNPFNPMTTIPYLVASEDFVDAAVFDVRGRRLRTLVSEIQPAGTHAVVWDGKDRFGRQVATGLYFYRLQVGEFTAVRKMVLMK